MWAAFLLTLCSLVFGVTAIYGLVEGLNRCPEEIRDRGAQSAGVFSDAAQFGDDVPHQHHRPQEHLIFFDAFAAWKSGI